MAVGTESRQESATEPEPSEAPAISLCESCPGKAVMLEEDNTDGWIASDTTCDVRR